MYRECTINVKTSDNLAIIEVLGDLTASSEKLMYDAYKEACEYTAKNIIIKFDGKSRINSAGIALIITMVIESQDNNRKIFLTGVSKHFRKIFELVGLTKYTAIVESEKEVKVT
ncbi:MAG: anti-sigma factor antagonist [Candidatus Poribacteria bacterium]|nr:anti-sigma factor antagonist [Candidatus Poribacteria bacterium]